MDDTIAALASAPGGAQRGIVRISGPGLLNILSALFLPDDSPAWSVARTASVHSGSLRNVSSRAAVRVSTYIWPNRRSYTGQPLAELHLPGSPPLLEAVLSEVYRHGARPARPGEFTLRAFLAGKLDLLQAEAVLGVIDAHDHAELETALSQLAGGMSGQLSRLRRDLLELLADLEAGLDFVEEDISFVSRCEVQSRIASGLRFVQDLLQQSSERMHSNARPRVVLAGLPNAGKSTLFNRLAGEETAIVSPQPGTTRDFLTAHVTWHGMTFELVDTAGWEFSTAAISESAQQKRAEQFRTADLIIWCSAANLAMAERPVDDQRFTETSRYGKTLLRVLTQIDCQDAADWLSTTEHGLADVAFEGRDIVSISAVQGLGIDDLLVAIEQQLSSRGAGRQWLGMTAARCRECLEYAARSLERAEEAAACESIGDELIAVDIRESLDQLGQILGTIYTDDILDRVFSKFCIGK